MCLGGSGFVPHNVSKPKMIPRLHVLLSLLLVWGNSRLQVKASSIKKNIYNIQHTVLYMDQFIYIYKCIYIYI